MTVGDFAGLSVDEIALSRTKRSRPSPREVFEKAAEAAAELRRETDNFTTL